MQNSTGFESRAELVMKIGELSQQASRTPGGAAAGQVLNVLVGALLIEQDAELSLTGRAWISRKTGSV